jgi:hypothetical protein
MSVLLSTAPRNKYYAKYTYLRSSSGVLLPIMKHAMEEAAK